MVVGAELGHQVGGVLGGVDAKGVGNHQQRLGERADGELLAGTLRGEEDERVKWLAARGNSEREEDGRVKWRPARGNSEGEEDGRVRWRAARGNSERRTGEL